MSEPDKPSIWDRDLITGQHVPPTPPRLAITLDVLSFLILAGVGVVLLWYGVWSTPFKGFVVFLFASAAGIVVGWLIRRLLHRR